MRKHLTQLTIEDLNEYPIRLFSITEEEIYGQDELTVQPYSKEFNGEIFEDAYFIIKVNYITANNKSFIGYIKPINKYEIPLMRLVVPLDMAPTIIYKGCHIGFSYGSEEPVMEEINKIYSFLDIKSGDDAFPIKFISDLPLNNFITNGVIDGFMYLDKNLDFFHIEDSNVKIKY